MKNIKLIISVFVLLVMCSSCKDDDLIDSFTFPSEYVYDGVEEIVEYYTYERQDGSWVRIANASEQPDFAGLGEGSYLDGITLVSANELLYEDFTGTYQEQYSSSGNTLNVTVDGQPITINLRDTETLSYRMISLMDDSPFTSSICGEYTDCSSEGIDDFVIDPGWLDNGEIIYVVVYDELFKLK